MKLQINRIDNKVVGINLPPSPLYLEVEVKDDFSLNKTIQVQEGEKQKLNELGEKLFLKEVYKTITKEVIVGQDETLKDTGVPIMLRVQKEDENGNELYLEPLKDEEGNITDYVEVVDTVDETGEYNAPIMLEVQKTSVNGQLLFYIDIIEEVEEEVLDYTEEIIEENDKPIMLPNMVDKYLNLFDNPSDFSIEEVLESKYQLVLDKSQKDSLLADLFIDEQDLDLADSNHSANTGLGILELHAKGQAKTKSLTLEQPSTEFELLEFKADEGVEIYLAGQKFINGKLTLINPLNSCTIKFVNTSEAPARVISYAIGY